MAEDVLVTEEQIANWKAEHGSVYVINVAGIDFYFRGLNRQDYIQIMQQQMSGSEADPEVETVQKCVLNDVPANIYSAKGGIATVIYEQIMLKSGFVVAEAEEL